MAHTGQCLCGAVTVSIDADPIGARTCWCRQCQKFGGGNGTTNAFFPAASIQSAGDLTWFESVADSGNTNHRAFCPKCGSHIFTQGSGAPQICGVRVSVLDDNELIAPQAVIFTDSAPSWALIDPALPGFPKAPPPVAPK